MRACVHACVDVTTTGDLIGLLLGEGIVYRPNYDCSSVWRIVFGKS